MVSRWGGGGGGGGGGGRVWGGVRGIFCATNCKCKVRSNERWGDELMGKGEWREKRGEEKGGGMGCEVGWSDG